MFFFTKRDCSVQRTNRILLVSILGNLSVVLPLGPSKAFMDVCVFTVRAAYHCVAAGQCSAALVLLMFLTDGLAYMKPHACGPWSVQET